MASLINQGERWRPPTRLPPDGERGGGGTERPPSIKEKWHRELLEKASQVEISEEALKVFEVPRDKRYQQFEFDGLEGAEVEWLTVAYSECNRQLHPDRRSRWTKAMRNRIGENRDKLAKAAVASIYKWRDRALVLHAEIKSGDPIDLNNRVTAALFLISFASEESARERAQVQIRTSLKGDFLDEYDNINRQRKREKEVHELASSIPTNLRSTDEPDEDSSDDPVEDGLTESDGQIIEGREEQRSRAARENLSSLKFLKMLDLEIEERGANSEKRKNCEALRDFYHEVLSELEKIKAEQAQKNLEAHGDTAGRCDIAGQFRQALRQVQARQKEIAGNLGTAYNELSVIRKRVETWFEGQLAYGRTHKEFLEDYAAFTKGRIGDLPDRPEFCERYLRVIYNLDILTLFHSKPDNDYFTETRRGIAEDFDKSMDELWDDIWEMRRLFMKRLYWDGRGPDPDDRLAELSQEIAERAEGSKERKILKALAAIYGEHEIPEDERRHENEIATGHGTTESKVRTFRRKFEAWLTGKLMGRDKRSSLVGEYLLDFDKGARTMAVRDELLAPNKMKKKGEIWSKSSRRNKAICDAISAVYLQEEDAPESPKSLEKIAAKHGVTVEEIKNRRILFEKWLMQPLEKPQERKAYVEEYLEFFDQSIRKITDRSKRDPHYERAIYAIEKQSLLPGGPTDQVLSAERRQAAKIFNKKIDQIWDDIWESRRHFMVYRYKDGRGANPDRPRTTNAKRSAAQ